MNEKKMRKILLFITLLLLLVGIVSAINVSDDTSNSYNAIKVADDTNTVSQVEIPSREKKKIKI